MGVNALATAGPIPWGLRSPQCGHTTAVSETCLWHVRHSMNAVSYPAITTIPELWIIQEMFLTADVKSTASTAYVVAPPAML